MILATDWGGTIITALAALIAAVIGGSFVLWGSNLALTRSSKEAAKQRTADREALELQYRRELLSRAAEHLFDALWTKERELCNALDLCRRAVADGVEVGPEDAALHALSQVEIDVYRDLICSLPYIQDGELRERMRSAGQVINDCMNIRAGSRSDAPHGGSVEMYNRAMIEVQHYFKWLRWNLACALQGEPLPKPVEVPDVRRPEGGSMFALPPGVPGWT